MKIDSRQEQPNELSTARKFAIKFCLFSGPLSISNLFQFATLIKIHTEKNTLHWFPLSFVGCFLLHFITSSSSSFISQLYHQITINCILTSTRPSKWCYSNKICVYNTSAYTIACASEFVLFWFFFCMHACMHECVSFLYAKIVVVKQNVSQMSLLLLPFYLFAFKPKIENHDKTRRIRRTKHMEKLSEQANERVSECECESVRVR